jgi:PAS domain S-box-containing protein
LKVARMKIPPSRPDGKTGPPIWIGTSVEFSPFYTAMLAGLVAVLSYLAARLGGALTLHPQTLCPLWPACALLVSILLLVPRKVWPLLIAAAFAAFVVYDLQGGLSIGSTLWLILADTVEVLIAALCVSYSFDGVPRLNSVRNLARYSFFAVILAPFAGAFVGAMALNGDYWINWRVSFFSEALAFLTLTPAVLSWVSEARAWSHKSRAEYLEATVLTAALILLGYFTFISFGKNTPPALLYSLIPFLLWSGLRFGATGISTSVIVVAFLSIWGAVHGRGPFTGPDPLSNVLSLQLFLFFAATPFMVLAALVDEHKQAEEALRKSEERLRLAVQAGKMFAYEWDPTSDLIVRSAESAQILGVDDAAHATGQQTLAEVHPDDREYLIAAVAELSPEKPTLEVTYRVVRPDGTLIWLQRSSRAHFDGQGRMLRIIGIVADITARKLAETELALAHDRLRLAMESGKSVAWDWDVKSGRDSWFGDLRTVFGIPSDSFVGHVDEFRRRIHPDDQERVWKSANDAMRNHKPYMVEFRTLWPDGTVRWVEATGKFYYSPDGEAERMLGMDVDITERKLAEEALAAMRRSLIEAQEQERTRIARDLHDDTNQRLALLAVAIDQLKRDLPNPTVEILSLVDKLRKETSEISNDIQALSHELHSPRLEYLGLVAAMKGFCKEFGTHQKVEIDFKSHDLPSPLPPDISLCLFRVLQEALHNSAKHSGAQRFEVQLWGTLGEVHLRVSDSGTGFDLETAMKSRGIGLTSMQERLQLVKGDFSIDSQPQRGTTIHARVPLHSGSDSIRAAG